jgi:hypothetical protein
MLPLNVNNEYFLTAFNAVVIRCFEIRQNIRITLRWIFFYQTVIARLSKVYNIFVENEIVLQHK